MCLKQYHIGIQESTKAMEKTELQLYFQPKSEFSDNAKIRDEWVHRYLYLYPLTNQIICIHVCTWNGGVA